ncbi:DUF4062 domain-containing protein [Prevotella sp. CAG:255]|jgi:hypothetical protein|uniref:DUF4062 domain-containing protein n=1 Tax=Prevotella sp. CAG:255 TaxID=1262923 RepID=UPI00033D08EF|nr:DUF4062 domain-containing protein [Prevotella sp. CAG:255]CCX68102.1 putative uncharacterized protein [Prevotella sp. CAG:255]
MDKKYQVFVSSTYQDLIEERQKVIEALISKNCFPVGMEYFPAASEEQFAVIKKLIDRCDYYILILGGRYGSIEPKTGKSYTQLEYEYALNNNIPVAAFYHKAIGDLSYDKVEQTDEGKHKYDEFKKLVQNNLCKSWGEAYELAFKVNSTLDFMFENYPRTGWVKADEISSAEANRELITLRKENDLLKAKISALSSQVPKGTEEYQQGNDKFTIRYGSFWEHFKSLENIDGEYEEKEYKSEFSWNHIFLSIATTLLQPVSEQTIQSTLEKQLLGENYYINKEDFQTILIQLMALKLITSDTIKYEGVGTFWTITEYGKKLMVQLLALKK